MVHLRSGFKRLMHHLRAPADRERRRFHPCQCRR
jgi:hypothetical protein